MRGPHIFLRGRVFLLALTCVAPAATPAGGETVDTVVRAVYEVISGPAGPRDWARFQSLFAEGARLIPVRLTAEGSSVTVMTPDEFARRAGANSEKNGFYKSETARRVETFGNIAHVFSTYESRRAPGEKPFARGINSFQLVKIGNSWKVMTILWDAEREGNPIPEKYVK
jgi:hypothetical protein